MLFKRLPVADAVFSLQTLPAALADYQRDEVRLAWTARADTRGRHTTEGGVEFGVMLPPGRVLADGDCLALDAPRTLVVVRAIAEPVLVTASATPRDLARWAYLLGNSHQPLMLDADVLVCPDTRDAEQVLSYYAIPFTRDTRAFSPEPTGPGHH